MRPPLRNPLAGWFRSPVRYPLPPPPAILLPVKLFLFDIDGTILHTHGSGRRAVAYAVERVVGRPLSTEPISFSGKTDPLIFLELIDHYGLATNGDAHALADAMLAHYREKMRETLPTSKTTLLSGVADLLDTLAGRDDAHLALLTGNVEDLAFLKLEQVGVHHHFSYGAFGSDSHHRPDLPAIAAARAREQTGHTFVGHDIVIIGDTEHDIRCGHGVGAFSVAVCTGHFDRAALACHEPDLLLDSLEDAAPILALLD